MSLPWPQSKALRVRRRAARKGRIQRCSEFARRRRGEAGSERWLRHLRGPKHDRADGLGEHLRAARGSRDESEPKLGMRVSRAPRHELEVSSSCQPLRFYAWHIVPRAQRVARSRWRGAGGAPPRSPAAGAGASTHPCPGHHWRVRQPGAATRRTDEFVVPVRGWEWVRWVRFRW